SVEAIVSFEDELFRRYAPVLSAFGAARMLGGKPLSPRLFRRLVEYAQNKAERQNRKVRLDTIRRDRKWLLALGFVGAAKK
ncbi:MAG TPA: preprotein translocase subunit SecA, partial [Rhodocyclaceae bacterium]